MELVCTTRLELNETLDCKNKELYLEYYLLNSIYEDLNTYGMQINMTTDTGDFEKVVIHDILTSKDDMTELIKHLQSNSVTPVTALDVVYDFIA